MEEVLEKIRRAVLQGEEEEAAQAVLEAIGAGLEPPAILEKSMMPAMEDIGARFSAGEAFIPELIVAASAMEAGMRELKPHLGGAGSGRGKVVLGTVAGDIHSIGKNLVRMCLEGSGFEVVDIGEDLKTGAFVAAYREHRPDVMGLSALLSSTMQRMQEVIEAVRAVDPFARIIVGGAPVTQDFADSIQATGYAPNAFEAAVLVKYIVGV